MTVRNLQHLHGGVTLEERITWAEARLQSMEHLAAQHPGDMLYIIAVSSRRVEVEQLKALRG